MRKKEFLKNGKGVSFKNKGNNCAMHVLKNDLTKGSVLKNLMVFAAPTFFLTVVQALISLTDLLIASNFGGVDVAAEVGMGGQLAYLIVTAVIGFSTGAAILFGRLAEKADKKSYFDAVNNYVTLSILGAVLLAGIFIPLSLPLLRLLATPEVALRGASQYFILQICGMVFVLLFQAVNALFRGRGESLPPLVFLAIGGALNVGLDFLFLLVFQWGAAGISAATIIAEAFALAVALGYLHIKKVFPLKKLRLKLQKKECAALLKLGVPLAIENTAASISFLIMTFMINKIGGADAVFALAASAICMRLNAFFMLPARAISMAISAMVAQNIAVGAAKRARQTVGWGLLISVCAGVCLTLACLFGAQGMLKIFGAEEKVLTFGVPYLRAFAADYLILPLSVCLFGWADGLGKTAVSMTVNIFTSFGIRIPLSFLLSAVCGLGITGVGLAIPSASLVAGILMVLISFGLARSYQKAQRLG